MVELMVGLFLLAIVLAMVGRPLVSALTGAAKAEATASVEGMVEDAEDRFSTDTMAAFTPDRDRSRIRDAGKFQRALTQTGYRPTSDIPSENGRLLDVQDVPKATGHEYWVRADVLATTEGTECVRYTAGTGERFSLRREVVPGTSCAGNAELDEMLVRDAPRIAGITDASQPVFSYSVLEEGTCELNIVTPGAPGQPAEIGGTDLNRIMAVQLRVSNVVQRGKAASAATNVSLVGIRSRSAYDYRTALGC